jgi:hypothetical protein
VPDRPELLTHRCAACGAQWFGLDRAHCTSCPGHATFDDVALYDAHRPRGTCLPPRSVGLVRNKGGVWQRPQVGRPRAAAS